MFGEDFDGGVLNLNTMKTILWLQKAAIFLIIALMFIFALMTYLFESFEISGIKFLENLTNYYVTLAIGILTVFFPISISVITSNLVGETFSLSEVSEVIFENIDMKMVNYLFPILFLISIFLNQEIVLFGIIQFIILCITLYFYIKFLNEMKIILTDFSNLLRNKKREKLNEFIKRNS